MNRLILITAAVLVFIACNKKKEDEQQPQNNPTPTVQRHVEYKIICSDCTVIYTNGHGDTTVSEANKNNSWSYSFEGKAGDPVTLFAYNTSSTPQGVGACIFLNGDTLKELTRFCAVSSYSFVTDTLH
jgi:hypothetical protein